MGRARATKPREVIVMLTPRQVARLDRTLLRARERTGRALARSHAIRGLIDGALGAKLNWADFAGEEEIAAAVADRLRRVPQPIGDAE